MPERLIYFDVAALVIFVIVALSLVLRGLYRDRTSQVFMLVVVVFTITCVFEVAEDAALGLWDGPGAYAPYAPVLTLGYYAFRQLAAPSYLMYILSCTNTTHLVRSDRRRDLPLASFAWASFLLAISNPLTHIAFTYDESGPVRAPTLLLFYLVAAIFALIAVYTLVKWRRTLDRGQFVALVSLFPLNGLAVATQFLHPELHVEMFANAIATLLVAMIVQRPERRLDPLSGALSYGAYTDEVHASLVTGRPMTLTYVMMDDYDTLRRMVGHGRYYQLVRRVTTAVGEATGPVGGKGVHYLKGGLVCVIEEAIGEREALEQARRFVEATRRALSAEVTEAQFHAVCVQVPTDVSEEAVLSHFVGHLKRLLVGAPEITSYAELERDESFSLKMDLDQVIERGIERGGFSVYLQPILCVETGTFRTAEALVRLVDERYGFVSPGLFIPEAERNGQVVAIGDFVLEETARFMSQEGVASLGVDYVEVNLSVDQCVRADLPDKVSGVARAFSLPPSSINLEITETAAGYSEEAISNNVRRLVDAGFTFSIDDYGTGYSNVSRLMKLPFSLVKIDKSLVDDIADSSMATVIASTIDTMHAIGKHVLAEGVETGEQAETLMAMGIDFIQGFYYARPMPEQDYLAFLRRHQRDAGS